MAADNTDGMLSPRRRATLRPLLSTASMEVAVRNVAEIAGLRDVLPAGTPAYVPWLPAVPYHHLVAVSTELARCGFVPVPHLAARRLPDEASAGDVFARLSGEAGVTSVLLVGGDVDRPLGPYDSAAALLRSPAMANCGLRRVGFAAYPEGHPRIAEPVLRAALRDKIAAAGSAGIEPFIVSQFCFEAGPILGWLERLRRDGVDAPVRIGLAGPASMRTLIAYGVRCGVGASLRVVKGRGISLTRLVSAVGPEAILAGIAALRESGAFDAGAALHFFSFGGAEKTARWIAALRRG